MVQTFKLEAKARDTFGSRISVRLRRGGSVPCVMLHKKAKPVHLAIDARAFEKAITKGARLIDLAHPGGTDKVFIKEVQWDHLGEKVLHIDFTKVAMDELLTLDVDCVLKGKPIGVIEEGASLDHFIKVLKVQCLPSAIPDKIEVDVAHLKKDESLKLKEIKAPAGVKLLGDPETVKSLFAPFVEHGFKLALDDFGSGYSSFQYLADLPVSFLKIDGRLIQRLHESRIRAIVRGIQNTARELGLITLAEYVEQERQANILREMGVNWAQGHYFSKAAMDEKEAGQRRSMSVNWAQGYYYRRPGPR